jgi:hypothetical protein
VIRISLEYDKVNMHVVFSFDTLANITSNILEEGTLRKNWVKPRLSEKIFKFCEQNNFISGLWIKIILRQLDHQRNSWNRRLRK